ncbi:MAG: 30S ribosomal protein S4 [Thermoplasmata archaeon]|nr:30S ribosomal protein S4 [Thermoplasmata archaeon]
MGDPRRLKKKYETPPHPWQEDRIKYEHELVKKFGLKNKREIWKAQTILRKYRAQARYLLPRANSEKHKKEIKQLMDHLFRMNLLKPGSSLADVLSLTVEDILSRRLQTIVYLKGLASTPRQARQFIVHGHIAIGGRKVTIPSYMVKAEEEPEIGYAPSSPLNEENHPARPPADMIKRRVGLEMEKSAQSG